MGKQADFGVENSDMQMPFYKNDPIPQYLARFLLIPCYIN